MEDSKTIKFIVTASLTQDSERNIKLSEPLTYVSENIQVTISNHEEDSVKLLVTLEVETTDKDRAHFIAESELLRIANLLSWEKSVPIKGFRVGAMHYSTKPGNMNAVGFMETLTVSAKMSLNVTLGEQGIRMLEDKFSNAPTVPEEIQLMWREAVSESSKSMQFLLYYRILEYINGNKRKGADTYIKKVDPTVALEKGLKNEDVSVYTYLRDNIHAKNPSFPYKDIERYLPKLSSLVRTAIENTYSGNI